MEITAALNQFMRLFNQAAANYVPGFSALIFGTCETVSVSPFFLTGCGHTLRVRFEDAAILKMLVRRWVATKDILIRGVGLNAITHIGVTRFFLGS
jgi:hypothetical protein